MEKYMNCRWCSGPMEFVYEEHVVMGEPAFSVSCKTEDCRGRAAYTDIGPDGAAVLLDSLSEILSLLSVKCFNCGDVDPFRCEWCRGVEGSWNRNHDYSLAEITDVLMQALYPDEQVCLFEHSDLYYRKGASGEFSDLLQRVMRKGGPVSPNIFPQVPVKVSQQPSWTSDRITWTSGSTDTYTVPGSLTHTGIWEMTDPRHDTVQVTAEELKARAGITKRHQAPIHWTYDEAKMIWTMPRADYEAL